MSCSRASRKLGRRRNLWQSDLLRPEPVGSDRAIFGSARSGNRQQLDRARAEGSGDESLQLVARRRRGRRRTGGQPVIADDQLSPIESGTIRLPVRHRAAVIESSTAVDLETDPARMSGQSSPGNGRSSNFHGYWVPPPVIIDRRKSPDNGQPQRTPSFPINAIWPIDHTGGADGYECGGGVRPGPEGGESVRCR